MSTAGAAFSVRFLRNGDQIIIVRNIINRNGDGVALLQSVDTTSGDVVPTWNAEGKSGDDLERVLDAQPIIQLAVKSAAGYNASIRDVTWAYNGSTLNFVYDGSNWVTATNDSRFQARINGNFRELKIIGDLASVSAIANRQITYDVGYVSNTLTDRVQGSVDVIIQTAGSDSHIVQVTTNRVELDDENTTATLTAVAYYGASSVTIGSNGYTVEWYNNGEKMSQTSRQITVTRDMVNGGSIFVAKLLLNGNIVAQDSQRINDIADEYQIVAQPTNAGSNYVGVNHNAVYTLSLYKNGVLQTDGNITYSWIVFNALGEQTAEGTGSTVTILPEYCIIQQDGKDEYADCDVQVTAEIS